MAFDPTSAKPIGFDPSSAVALGDEEKSALNADSSDDSWLYTKDRGTGFLSNVGGLINSGVDSAIAAARLSGDVATGDIDKDSAGLISGELNREKPAPAELEQATGAFKEAAADWRAADDKEGLQSFLGKAEGLTEMIYAVGHEAVMNPKGLAYLTAEQAANMAPSILGMVVGAKTGAFTGAAAGTAIAPGPGTAIGTGVGTVVGGIGGAFAGEWPIEAGSEFIGQVGSELAARNLAPTEENVATLLADSKFMEKTLGEVRTKATVTSGIDAAFTLGAGRLATAPAKAALKDRALRGAGAVALDVTGGGVSEAGGELAAYGEVDLENVGAEMLGELGGSAIEVPAAVYALRNEIKTNPKVTPSDILAAETTDEAIQKFTEVVSTDNADNIQADELLVDEPTVQPQEDANSPLGQAAPPFNPATAMPVEADNLAEAPLQGESNGQPATPESIEPPTGSTIERSNNADGSATADISGPSGIIGEVGTAVSGMPESGAGTDVAAQPGTADAVATFGTNSAGKITLRGVPMEQIQAIRNKMGAKGWIIGKDSAVFPKGTDLKTLQDAFGIEPPAPVAKQKKPRAASSDLLTRIKQLGGINTKYASDVTGEQKPKGAWKFAFGKNGLGLDDLATQLSAEGFNIDMSDVADNGGVNQLSEMIRQHIGGERAFKATTQEAQADAMAEDRDYVAMRQRAEELGIKVKGLGNGELADAIYAAEDDLAMQALDAQEELSEEESAAISQAADMIEDGFDIPFGDEVKTNDAALAAFLGEPNEQTSEAAGQDQPVTGQSRTTENAESRQQEAGGTSAEGAGEQAQDGAGRSAQAGSESQESERPLLESYTNAEVVQREAAKAKAEEEAGKEPPAQNVTADQVDLFNTQDSLFSSNREQPADASPEIEKAQADARRLGVPEEAITAAGNDLKKLNSAIGKHVMSADFGKKKPADTAKTKASPIADLLSKFEESGEIGTMSELVDKVEALDDLPKAVQDAIDTYREEAAYDRELKGRGDMDSAGEMFLSVLRSAEVEQANELTPSGYLYHTTAAGDGVMAGGLQSAAFEQSYDPETGEYLDDGEYDEGRQVIWFSPREEDVMGRGGVTFRVKASDVEKFGELKDGREGFAGSGVYVESAKPFAIPVGKIEVKGPEGKWTTSESSTSEAGNVKQEDPVSAKIADAESRGVVLSNEDKADIRESFARAEELRRKANGTAGRASDPMNKGNAFPMGVGFTKMTKRASQRIDSSVKRAGEAVALFKKAEIAEKRADDLLAGKGTEADKIRKNVKREEMRSALVEKLVNFSKGSKIGPYTIERVNKDRDGYPATYTISGEGVIKGVMDKVDVVREFFGGDKTAFRGMVDSARQNSSQSKKLEVLKAQAAGKISGDQGAALKELADAGEHAAVDEVLKPATHNASGKYAIAVQRVTKRGDLEGGVPAIEHVIDERLGRYDSVKAAKAAYARMMDESLNRADEDYAAKHFDQQSRNQGDVKVVKAPVEKPTENAQTEKEQKSIDKTGGIMFSKGKKESPPTLIIQHNLSEQNLLHADRMGGIPIPSLAITQAEHPLEGFGEITLVGGVDMADPKGYAATKVFGADIYSPRYPKITHKVDSKAMDAFNRKFKEMNDLTGARPVYPDDISSEGLNAISDNAAVMAYFLTGKGITPTVVTEDTPKLDAELMPFKDDQRMDGDLAKDPAFQAAAIKHRNRTLLALNEGDEELAKQEYITKETDGFGRLMLSYARDVSKYQRDLREAGKPNQWKTKTAIREQIDQKNLGDEYADYAQSVMDSLNPDEKIFQGFTNMGNRKYIPHTLDNVIKLLKKELRGGENFNYGVGTIRSKFTPQFKSIAQIRAAKDRLMDNEKFAEVKSEIDEDFDNLANEFREYHPIGDKFGFMDTMSSTLYDAATMGLPRAFRENGFESVPQEKLKDAADFLDKLRTLPTEYFEAKILRAVDLSEFKGAVVPQDISQKALDVLKARGITNVLKYDKNDTNDRAAKIKELAQKADLLFSQSQSKTNAGQTVESVKQATQTLRNQWLGFQNVSIIESVKDVPNEIYLRAQRAATPIDQGTEGIYDPVTKTVYLIAGNLATPERAVLVAAHEVVGHGGIRMLGKPVADVLDTAGKNSTVAKMARAIAADRAEQFDAKIHTDEAMAELAAATITEDVDAVLERYGVKVPNAMRQNLLGSIKRVIDAVRKFISKVFGKPSDKVSDSEIYGMLQQMRAKVEGVEKAETEQGMSDGKAMASNSAEARFYSQLHRSVNDAPDRIFQTGKQVSLWLQANAAKLGVKKDELQWSGVTDWLNTQGKVSKADVLTYLDGNGVQVQDVMLGQGSAEVRAQDEGYAIYDNGEFVEWYETEREAKANIATLGKVGGSPETKFASYQLPGGENYRELLLTLPSKHTNVEPLTELPEGYDVSFDRTEPVGRQYSVIPPGQIHGRPYGDIRGGTPEEAKAGALEKLNIERQIEAQNNDDARKFRSDHYTQPNILAHVRFNERVDAEGGRVLFLEEIQSDYGQKGKKEGFAGGLTAEETARKERIERDGKVSPEDADWYNKRINDATIPAAPFVTDTKSWTALALKRMIAYAVENGFDKIAFTTGEQQAARYDLSKQISKVTFTRHSGGVGKAPDGLGAGMLRAYDLSGKKVINEYLSDPEKIEDYVGKEVAKKLTGQPGTARRGRDGGEHVREVSGLDLKVGGEGMKGYYDQIVPQVANDILKKIGGGKVESLQIKARPKVEYTGGEAVVTYSDGKVERYDSMYAANAVADAYLADASQEQPGFAITDAMRAKVQGEGLALFSKQVTADDLAEMMRLLSDDSWSTVESKELTENEADTAATLFLSDFPEGTRTYSRSHRLAKSIRAASDAAANDLGGKALAERTAQGALGKFTSYETSATRDADGTLNVEFYGKEQIEEGLTDEPALLFSVTPEGEVIVNGPNPLGKTFKEFEKRGWAEPATAKGEVVPGWTRLIGTLPNGKLPLSQVTKLIGEVHARARLNKGVSHIGLHFHRSTGMLGLTDDEGAAIFFSKSQSNLDLQGGQSGNPASWDSPEASKLDDFIYTLQDKHIDMKRVVASIKDAGGKLIEKFNPYLSEELFHGRAAKRTHDFVNTELRPLLTDMQMRGLDVDELDQYLHARHAKEANALIAERDPEMQDGGSGMTDAEVDEYMQNLPESTKNRLESVAIKVDAIITKTRDLYVSYGLISKDQADSWAEMFQHYVPLMREDNDGGMGLGQGFSIKGKEVKHRTGSKAKVVDILANIALQREKAITRGEKNRVAVALAGLVKLNPNPDFWTFGKPPVERVLNEKTGLVEDRIDPTFKSRPNVVVAKIKDSSGQVHERAIIFSEDNERAMRMAESFKNLDHIQLGGVMGVSAMITRYFASINTQYNPVFGIVNITRDIQAMALNLSSTPIAKHRADVVKLVPSAVKGIYQDMRSERSGKAASSKWAQLWEELQDEGGMTGYRDLYRNSEDRANEIKRELNPTRWHDSALGKVFTANGVLKVPMSVAQEKAGWLFDWLSDYNQTLEGATRLAAYKVAIDNGMSKREAASLSKNITVNFNRKGHVGQQAGAMYAFFNAAVQGTARIAETMLTIENGKVKLTKAGKTIVYGGILMGAMQAIALAAAGFDDNEPPEFVRERALIIPIGGKKYITIPMPLGFHVFPNLGRVPTEWAMGGFKDTGKRLTDLVGIVIEAFNPMGSAGVSLQTIMPTALDPAIALAENKDWTGKPIYQEDYNSMKPTPGFERNKDTATAWAKGIAEALNMLTGGTDYSPGAISPTADQIDFLIGQVTGGVGREIGKIAQTGESAITGEALPPHKVPVMGRFYGNAENQSSQGNAYYSNLKRIYQVEAEIKGRREDRLPIDEYKADNPEWRLITRARYADRIIHKLKKHKRELVEKGVGREKIRAIEDRITAEMKRLNDAARKMEEKMGD